ncbi:helix-turn-helix transcriptional regulator [Chitiniphilus shinanonensis]|uniref:helix-turn-helix transcriptional regulator n=1 Tax=Chitiniphilus shinanonensis TaxID=553088 RepID=UPI000A056645|nr:AlpA family transcriptional regulator [Chitiniphilus shinanonensis]
MNGTSLSATTASASHPTVQALPPGTRLLRLPEVLARVGLSKTVWYGLIKQHRAPSAIAIGGRAVAWIEPEIEVWIQQRVHAARGGDAPAIEPSTPRMHSAAEHVYQTTPTRSLVRCLGFSGGGGPLRGNLAFQGEDGEGICFRFSGRCWYLDVVPTNRSNNAFRLARISSNEKTPASELVGGFYFPGCPGKDVWWL